MALPRSITGAWRALSRLKQVDIATAKTVNVSFYFEGDPMEPEPETFFANKDEITGALLPTVSRLLNRKLVGKHKSKAYPDLVGLLASMAMFKDTSTVVGATTAYKHKIEMDAAVVELPYRTLVENDGLAQFVYTGVACTGFTLSGKRGEFVEIEADLLGSGAEATDATSKPARVSESYLAYGDVKFYKGGTYDGTSVTGATELSADLKDFKISLKNNAKHVFKMGDATGNVGSIRRGLKFDVEFEATIELSDQTHRTDFLAGTEFVCQLPIVGGTANGAAKYTVEAIFPRLVYKAAKKGVDDGILKLAANFEVLHDATYGGLILNVINLQSASFLA